MPAWKVGSGEVTNLPMLERMARHRPARAALQRHVVVGRSGPRRGDGARRRRTGRRVPVHDGLSLPAGKDRAQRASASCASAIDVPGGLVGPFRHDLRVAGGGGAGRQPAGSARRVFARVFWARRAGLGHDRRADADWSRACGSSNGHWPPARQASSRPPRWRELRTMFGKSVVAARDLPAGHVLAAADLALKKPGTGIPAARLAEVIGRRLTQAGVGEYLAGGESP